LSDVVVCGSLGLQKITDYESLCALLAKMKKGSRLLTCEQP
jgi:hypothetical protein